MARTDQGNALTELKLQPGSRFVRTRSGLDTGSRTWHIDQAYAERKAPKNGDADSVYRTMFVDEVEIVSKENGLAEVTARYLGLINPRVNKPDDVVKNADADYLSSSGFAGFRSVTFLRARPRVTVTYVRSREAPITEVGMEKTPPGFEGKEIKQGYEKRFRPAFTPLFAGWVLASRQTRQGGLGGKGTIYEMTDVYTYEVIELEALS